MWWRNRKESWPPRSTQLGTLRTFAESPREALVELPIAFLHPSGAALDYFAWHPNWLAGMHPDRKRRSR